MTLKPDVPVEESIADLELRPPEPEKLVAFLEKMEFRTLTSRIKSKWGLEGEAAPTPAAPADVAPGERQYECVKSLDALER